MLRIKLQVLWNIVNLKIQFLFLGDKLLFQYSGLKIAYFIHKLQFILSIKQLKSLAELYNKMDERIV